VKFAKCCFNMELEAFEMLGFHSDFKSLE